MVFVKGHKKMGGRPKGSKSKRTQQWEQFASWFLSEGMTRLEQEMKSLKGKDYVVTVKDLLEYFKPKLSRNDNYNTHKVEDLKDILDGLNKSD